MFSFLRRKKRRVSLVPVGVFTAVYLIVATPFAVGQNNTEFLFYIGVVILLSLAVVVVHRRVGLSRGLLWALSIWGLLHMLGGLVEVPPSWPHEGSHAVLYSWWIVPGYLKYDHPIHAYGFAVATWMCWEALRAAAVKLKASFGVLLLCALGGMGLGAVNEIVEFVATLILADTNVGSFENVGWHLVSNAVGSLFAIAVIGTRRG
jgi:uncharacterized membrane protein YjdF